MTRPPYVLDTPIQAAAPPEVRNHTPFPSQYFQMVDSDDKVFHVLVSRVTYDMNPLDDEGCPSLAQAQQALVASEWPPMPMCACLKSVARRDNDGH